MAGIDKMTEAILAEARNEAEKIVDAARQEANAEKDAAFAKIAEETAHKKASLDKEIEDYRLRAESARDLTKRRMILEKKQEIIARIVEKIRASLHDADSTTYFANLYKMFEKYCQSENGKMHLNSKDLGRLPMDFSSRLDEIARRKGGSIEVDRTPSSIEDGFVLSYAGTEENCTFRSLIETEKEVLCDEINKMLWRDANG